MEIIFDTSFFYELLELPPHQALWLLFIRGGWIIFLIVFLMAVWKMRLFYIQEKYRQSVKYVLLAIDVPKENKQSPKAVEHIFANLSAAQSGGNLVDRYIEGYTQQPFSLEIISIGGYIQFLIRAPEKLRDLAEAAIYAQYPDAEISEVEDYTKDAPEIFPNEEYDLWGSELILCNKEVYPIRTYPEFVEPIGKDEFKFKDPMASLLEVLGRMNPGEQVWLQLVITPCKSDWKDKGMDEVKKIIGQKAKAKMSLLDLIIDSPVKLLEKIGDIVFIRSTGEEKKERELPSTIGYLSPGELEVVKSMQRKLAKTGFQTRFRMIYLAKKEIFNKGKAISGVMGAIQQFSALDRNGFKPEKNTKTGVDYWFVRRRVADRQRRIMANYKSRSNVITIVNPYILNSEELATLYHFPVAEVKSPFLKKVEMKRGEAPSVLPAEEEPLAVIEEDGKKGEPPVNLPIE